MANPFIHVFAGDVAQLGQHAVDTAEQHRAHLTRMVSETENLQPSFQCTAADLNSQGVYNQVDYINPNLVVRGHTEGENLQQAANTIDGTISDTALLMQQQLNL